MSSNRLENTEAPKLDLTAGASFDISNLFNKDNQRSLLDMAKSALPAAFDNGFSISGLENMCQKGMTALKFDDNMPVIQFDSRTGMSNMPVVPFDSSSFPGDNMPVITPNDSLLGMSNGGCEYFDGIGGGKSSADPEYSIGNAVPHSGMGNGGTDIPGGSGQASSGGDIYGATGGTDVTDGAGQASSGCDYTPGSTNALKSPHSGGSSNAGEGSSWAPLDGANSTPDATLAPDEDRVETTRPSDVLQLPNEGRSITDLDAKINPRLGCALAVSTALHEMDKDFPVTTNNRELARLLIKHGYDMSKQEGGVQADQLKPGDVIIGKRQGDMPGHTAIYKGEGKTYENNSDTGRITGDGDLNYFNNKMHDSKGNWNKNGFDSVYVFRKLSPADQAKRDAEIASHY